MSADARTAVGAVFGAVNETALTMTAAVTVVSKSVSMLNGYIAKEATKQVMRDKIEMSDYLDRLIKDSAKESARTTLEIENWLKGDESRKPIYAAALERYTKLFEEKAEGE